MTAGRAPRTAGCFTLFEALCVLAVVGLLLAAATAALSSTVRSFTAGRAALREARIFAGVERTLRRDLSSACALRVDDLPAFVARGSGSGGTTSRIEFFTTNSPLSGETKAASPVRRVEYEARASERFPGRTALFRRETAFDLVERRLDAPGPAEALADDLAGCDFAVWAGREWTGEWSRPGLPAAVRVQIEMPREGTDGPARYVFVSATGVTPDADPMPSAPSAPGAAEAPAAGKK
jgi:type II secretory pathway component PulJ